MTTAVIAMLFFGGNYQKSLTCLADAAIFSQFLSRSRFSRRAEPHDGVPAFDFQSVGQYFQRTQFWNLAMQLDSYPVAMCQNIRIKRNRLTSKFPTKKLIAAISRAKSEYFLRCAGAGHHDD